MIIVIIIIMIKRNNNNINITNNNNDKKKQKNEKMKNKNKKQKKRKKQQQQKRKRKKQQKKTATEKKRKTQKIKKKKATTYLHIVKRLPRKSSSPERANFQSLRAVTLRIWQHHFSYFKGYFKLISSLFDQFLMIFVRFFSFLFKDKQRNHGRRALLTTATWSTESREGVERRRGGSGWISGFATGFTYKLRKKIITIIILYIFVCIESL